MSCKHLMWGHYCKYRQEFCEHAFEDKEYLLPFCKYYVNENTVEDISMKKLFNKGLAYEEKYPLEYRFVLTLILGYLNKLDSVAIINCDNPETYFEDKVADVCVPDLTRAIDKVRLYVKASKDSNLAEGMRRFDAWLERLRSKTIPPKELTIADIEKQLGYKIKIVGETNE